MAKQWNELSADDRFRFKVLGGGLRASFHSIHAAYVSDDAPTFFEAFEVKLLEEAEGLLLKVILSARSRGLTV